MLQKHKIRIKIFIKTGIPKGCNSLWSFFWERGEYEGLLYYVSHGWLIIAKQEFSIENSCRLKNYRM